MWYVVSEVSQKVKSFFGPLPFYVLLVLAVTSCGGPPQFPAEGEETPAVLELDANSVVDFTDRITGQDFIFTLQINNLSNSVPASNIVVNGGPYAPYSFTGGAFPGDNGNCGTTINEGSSCFIELVISPPMTGSYNTSIVLQYFDGLENQDLLLNLSADVRDPYPAILTFTPSTDIDYGVIAVGGFSEVTLTLENSGEQNATSIALNGLTSPFTIPATDCTAILTPGASCQLTLRFAPSTANSYLDSLNVDYNDSVGSQAITRNLSGEGRIAGFIAIDEGNNFDFAVILAGQQTDISITLRNTGGGNASAINLSGLAAPYSLVSNSCPISLTPGQSCGATVRYQPSATTTSVDQLNIDFFDGFNNQTSNADFVGQGFANPLDLSLINPVSSPSQDGTPTVRTDTLVSGLRIHLYGDALCTSELISAVSAGASLDLTPTLNEGTFEFHARAEDSDGNLTACSADSVNYEYDITPPAPPTNITFAQNYTSSSSQSPTIQWSASTSLDVVDYQVGISTTAGGGNSNGGFTSKGNVTSATELGLSMVECDYYYASVQSIDHVNLTSLTYAVSATPYRYDSAAPTPPSNLNEDGDSSATNSATITWTPGTDACGVSHYEVAVSEDTNGNNTLDPSELGNAVAFTNVGNITSHRFNAITLTNGVTHFTSIRTVDTTGRLSTEAVSDPWIVYDPSVELPDMIVWLDGNDPATVEDTNGRDALNPLFNGQVVRWYDKSGSPIDHDFSASSGSSRPSYDILNFSMVFDGASSGMTTPDHPEINNATVTQRNITVSFRTSADIASRQILYEEGGNIRGMNVYIFNNRLYCGFYNTPAGDGDGAQPFTWVSTPISTNQTYFVTWVFDYTNYTGPAGPDGNLTCYVNNVDIGSVPTTSRLFAHSGDVGLGHIDNQSCFEDSVCRDSGSHFLGDLFEVMLFNNAPDASDVTNVHTYLDNKWN